MIIGTVQRAEIIANEIPAGILLDNESGQLSQSQMVQCLLDTGTNTFSVYPRFIELQVDWQEERDQAATANEYLDDLVDILGAAVPAGHTLTWLPDHPGTLAVYPLELSELS